MIVSVAAWVVAIFGRKASKRDVSKPDIERPSIITGHKTSSTVTMTTDKRSSKPPKQKPVVTLINEEEEKRRSSLSNERSKLLITTTKTRRNTLVTSPTEEKDEIFLEKRKQSTENLPLSIHDDSIKPLQGLDGKVERPMKYGRRSSTLTPDEASTLTRVESSSSLKKDLQHISEE